MKKINLYNTANRHNLEKVSCYERPIADILNFYHLFSGDMFIIISKIYDMFKEDLSESTKEKALGFAENVLSFDMIKYNSYSSKLIYESVDSNIPVVVCGNLKEIFFTSYYARKDWPHWFLVKGCDRYTQTFCILDYIQFSVLGMELDDFTVTGKMLKKASKSYQKVYGKEQVFRIINKENFDYVQALISILELYLSFNKKMENTYTQKKVFDSIFQLRSIPDMSELSEELKKRLVNINKYKEVMTIELSNQMKLLGYEDSILKLLEIAKKNLKLWSSYTLRTIVDIYRNDKIILEIPQKIINCEVEYDVAISGLLSFIKENRENINQKYNLLRNSNECDENISLNHKINVNIVKATINNCEEHKLNCENNYDNIISANKKEIYFKFGNGKLYNWWIDDEAPKVIVFSSDITRKKVRLSCHVRIKDGYTEEKFQIGLFVRNRNNEKMLDKAYIGGQDNSGICVLGQVGEKGVEISRLPDREFEMHMEIEGDKIMFSMDDEGIEDSEFNNVGITELGLVCKTWGNGGRLEIIFSNITLEEMS